MNTKTGGPVWVVAVVAVLATLVAVLFGLGMSSQGASQSVAPVVDDPIAAPHASVKPNVANEMNGKPGKVDMAGKVHMHKAAPVPKGLTGNGQGNGCLKNYGEPGQCLPVMSPMQQAMPEMDHPWTCDEVRDLFPKGISVHGADTLGLDTNSDRTMCGPGDA
jgi:hypothetical protein